MAIMVGSARSDERGKLTGGQAGDQTGKELSTQQMYVHSKGWYILRPKSVDVANKIAEAMQIACNNSNIGYDQNQRLGIVTYGVNSKVKTEADCSSAVRACCIYAGFDPGNFTTANEALLLEQSGKFENRVAYVNQGKTPVYNGDVLVTKSKGHTVVVVSGNPRKQAQSAIETPKTGNPYEVPTVLICTKNTAIKRGYSSRQYCSKGNSVRWIQYELNNRKYKGKDGKSLVVDGDCGSNTEYAIKSFQEDNNLVVDGIAGPKTIGLLK